MPRSLFIFAAWHVTEADLRPNTVTHLAGTSDESKGGTSENESEEEEEGEGGRGTPYAEALQRHLA